MSFVENDGGRSEYFKGKNAGDCVCRALAIAESMDYKEAYDLLATASKAAGYPKSARNGVYKKVYEKVFADLGWHWVSAPKFVGRKARYTDMPEKGRYILRMAKHLSAVVDGELHDSWNSGHKMVYGYWAKK